MGEPFAKELMKSADGSTLEDFVAWRKDPRISSLVETARAIDADDLEQLLFAAEDYYSGVIRID